MMECLGFVAVNTAWIILLNISMVALWNSIRDIRVQLNKLDYLDYLEWKKHRRRTRKKPGDALYIP